jgi:alpha-tubulin suppressor-like RCC1 family protein
MTETFHATKTDGTLWGWGYNTTGSAFGDVGNNTSTTTFSSPVQIGTLTNWSKLAFGSLGYHGGAIKTDSTLWMWGVGTSGQLGNSTIVSVSSPIQIGTLTNWASLAGMTETFHATKTDGTLWSWGLNNAAQLGQNNVATGLSSPVQIGTLTNWANIAAGYRHGAAIKTDGTLWAWGYNTAGQLGDKTVTVRSSPVQIGTLTNWFGFALGRYFTVATKTDGTLWAWGSNTIGQLGTGDQNNRSSPVQIGQANTWTQIAAGQSHTVALKA